MTYDRRDKVAAGKALHEYIRDGEVSFLKEVAKECATLSRKTSVHFAVNPGVASPMITFDGEDASDLSIDGYLALVVNGNDVLTHMEMKHAMLGTRKDEFRTKIGVLTPAQVAKRLVDFIFGAR